MRKNKKSFKNEFGHVLIVAGSPSMLGAAALAGLAAMRSGAGLTTIAVPKGLNLTLQAKISPVIMTLPLPQTRTGELSFSSYVVLNKVWHKYQAMAIGPGLGLNPSIRKLVLKVIKEAPCPLVVDADALNVLAGHVEVLKTAKAPRILTPHVGEFARLTGTSKQFIEAHRKRTALRFAKQYNCALVLKGHRTVVASPHGKVFINDTGNPGLATAGSGDVLTGVVASFLAQTKGDSRSVAIAVRIHGRAGDLASRRFGKAALMATDIIENLAFALREREKSG